MSHFKGFKGGKSKAKKGLVRFDARLEPFAEELLMQLDGEWGFDTEVAFHHPALDAEVATEGRESVTDADETESESVSEEESTAPVASGNMFGNIANTLGAVAVTTPAPAARPPASDRAPYTIEKDRPEQNGVKRPSAGGLCRAVWDEMDALRELLGECPTPNLVRTAASENEWNPNNAMIEYYQWRKFNGITGRIVKAKAKVESPAAAA